jgi:hypothetical protein
LYKLTNFAPDRVVVFTYAKSLAWLAILAAVIVGIQNIVGLVLIDFIHGNPHRTQGNAIFMMIVYTPLLRLGALAGVLLVFTLPQYFQATISSALGGRLGSRAQAGVWVALPVTAALTWYCYDYLIPSNVGLAINEWPDWKPYQHGLTLARYGAALAFQVPATLFSVAYATAGAARPSRKTVILLALTAAIIAGTIMGHRAAEVQYQFL